VISKYYQHTDPKIIKSYPIFNISKLSSRGTTFLADVCQVISLNARKDSAGPNKKHITQDQHHRPSFLLMTHYNLITCVLLDPKLFPQNDNKTTANKCDIYNTLIPLFSIYLSIVH